MGEKSTAWWREPTRRQWFTFFAAWSGWVLDAFDFTIFLLVMPTLSERFHVPLTAAAGTVTLTLFMRLLGGLCAGSIADRWGRKLPLVISVAWFAVCDGAIAFAPSFGWVIALRVLFGFGMGAQWTSGTTMAMESWPERSRGIASGILQGSWAIGYLLAAGVTRVVIVHLHQDWRVLFLVAAVPALVVLPLQLAVPESDDWKREAAAARAASGGKSALRQLLAPDMLRRLLWASASMSIGLGAYYAFTGLYSTLLQTELGLGVGVAMTKVVLFNLGMLGGSVVFGMVAKRRGIAFAVALPALAMVPLLPLYLGAVPGLLWLGALVGGALGVGWAGTVPVYLTGLFPASVRARSIGIVYHVGAFFAALVPPAVTELARLLGTRFAVHMPLAWSIGILSSACLIGLSALLMLQPRDLSGRDAAAPANPKPRSDEKWVVEAA